MALFGRVGNILKQATTRKINSELCSFPSGFQAIRCFSNSPSTKLFIGGALELASTPFCILEVVYLCNFFIVVDE